MSVVTPEKAAETIARIMTVVRQQLVAMAGRQAVVNLSGTVTCAVCGAAVRWSYHRDSNRRGRGRQSFAFQCPTVDCVKGSGH